MNCSDPPSTTSLVVWVISKRLGCLLDVQDVKMADAGADAAQAGAAAAAAEPEPMDAEGAGAAAAVPASDK
jgi:hypothetical protein